MAEILRIAELKCHIWGYSPSTIADYIPVLSKFGADANISAWAEGFVGSHSGRCLWDAEFLSKTYRFSNCLNIGGAPFLFEHLLRRRCPKTEIVSLDVGKTRFPFVEQALGIRVLDLDIEKDNPAFADLKGKFECITLCEVFEHLRIDLIGTMSRIRELLSDSGILYLTTPNGTGLSALWNYSLKRRTGPDPATEWSRLHNIGHMGHIREYSVSEVRGLLERSGFTVDKWLYRRMLQGSRCYDYPLSILTWLMPGLSDELVMIGHKSKIGYGTLSEEP